MDSLAELAASSDPATSKQAIDVLDKIGQRYISKVVENNSCSAFSGSHGSWIPPMMDMTTSKAYGMKKLTNTKGCGWWGRGVIQTTGPCNFGKLQAALSKQDKYKGKFNLCKTPELICNTNKFPELKWLAGFFYWINEIQNYSGGDWDFKTAVGGDFKTFVDATSGLVNRGCPHLTCPSGQVDEGDEVTKKTRYNNAISAKGAWSNESKFNSTVLKVAGTPAPPQPYTYKSFISALKFVQDIGFDDGQDSGKFYGKEKSEEFENNIAAFLGQCMKETLQYGACDENNWTEEKTHQMADDICSKDTDCKTPICTNTGGKCEQFIYGDPYIIYPEVASCGQLGQYYREYTCKPESKKFACDPDFLNDRTIIANTHAVWWGAPGPLFANGQATSDSPSRSWNGS